MSLPSAFRRPRLRVVALAAVAAALAPCGLVSAAPASALTRPCLLFVEPTTYRENIIYPEETTTYEAGQVPVPPGGYTEITGEFPHSRFFSFETNSSNGKYISSLLDRDINPDRGSSNPFVPGGDRTTKHRSYTVRVLDAPVPAGGPAPNTIYSTSTDGTRRTVPGSAIVVLRYYLPDLGTGRLAGVPPPTFTEVTATGQHIPTPTCPDDVGDPGYTQAIAAFGTAGDTEPGTGPLVAHRVPVWHKFTNAPTGLAGGLTDNDAIGQAVYDPVSGYTTTLPAGFFENFFINYIYTATSTDFGQVVRIRARLPTHPHTFYGEPRMGTGQLRFWSMCTGNYPSTATYACAVDKDMPLDRNGDFTLAISTAADRPANAYARCGVAWLPAGPTSQTVVIMRNMIPAPGFKQAIQNVQPGHEQAQMGAYFPVSRYFATKSDFERLGCPATTARRTAGRVRRGSRRHAQRHRVRGRRGAHHVRRRARFTG